MNTAVQLSVAISVSRDVKETIRQWDRDQPSHARPRD